MAGKQLDGSGWFTIEGVALIALGLGALLLPMLAGLTAALILGWILVFTGIVGLAAALRSGVHAHRGWSIVSALIAFLVGLTLLLHPVAGPRASRC